MHRIESRRRNQAAAEAWAARAPELARWADELGVRGDAYGGHRIDGSRTTRHSPPTLERLARHFRAEDATDVIGLHVASPDEMCKTTWVDIDLHDGHDADPDANLRLARHVLDKARELGLDARLFDSNGKGGFHILMVHGMLIPMADSWRLGRFLLRHHADFGFAEPPESFPKSPVLTGKRFGGWVRLPGRHHKRDHYTRVWSPRKNRWLEGDAAIDSLLRLRGHDVDPATVVPPGFDPSPLRPDIAPVVDVPPPISPTDLPIDIVLSRLRGVSGYVNSFSACCPAHRDYHPSLSITEVGDGTLLLHCHAGCTVDAIMAALGLELSHLYASSYALRFGRRGDRTGLSRLPRDGGTDAETVIEYARLKAIWEQARENGGRLKELARGLGLPAGSLEALRVGFSGGRWAFPEVDDEGRVVGIVYRDASGDRVCEPGSRRGLTVPRGALKFPGPIHLVEGATDAAALHSVGVAVIGRPAAPASFLVKRWLGQLLRRYGDRDVIVVGDRDPVRNGKSAGRDGASSLSLCLRIYLGRPVPWALPRRPYKDVREQVIAGDWGRGLVQKGGL